MKPRQAGSLRLQDRRACRIASLASNWRFLRCAASFLHLSCIFPASFLLLLGGCAVRLAYPDAFQTGQVLARGQGEVEVHSYANQPFFATAACGIADGWEVRGGVGRAGDPLAAQLSVTSSILKTERWYGSGTFGFEVLSPDRDLSPAGYRVSGTYSAGYFLTSSFGIYLPLKFSVIHIPAGNYPGLVQFPGYDGSALVPGLGASFTWQGIIVSLAGNMPIALAREPAYLRMIPYAGIQLGYDFNLF